MPAFRDPVDARTRMSTRRGTAGRIPPDGPRLAIRLAVPSPVRHTTATPGQMDPKRRRAHAQRSRFTAA